MARRRFRWTRERYRKAHHLSRFYSRWVYDLPSDPPRLLQQIQPELRLVQAGADDADLRDKHTGAAANEVKAGKRPAA